MPQSGHEEWTLPDARREEYRPADEAGLERCRQAHRKTGRYSQVQNRYRKIVLEITRCVSIAGEIVRARTKEVSASDLVEGDLCRGVTSKLVEKGDHLLHCIWAWEPCLRSRVDKPGRCTANI